jgi:uncharacterized cysteine cluster protein YcgN (CxxCxxCC family)
VTSANDRPFWQRPLDRLDRNQWERLCDGCGRCCLHKLEDEETGEVYYTRVACHLLDLDTCRCTAYAERATRQPECVVISPTNVADLHYLPESCAYRLRAAGDALPAWHPLVSGDEKSVHAAGISVHAYALPLAQVDDPDDLEDFIIDPP